MAVELTENTAMTGKTVIELGQRDTEMQLSGQSQEILDRGMTCITPLDIAVSVLHHAHLLRELSLSRPHAARLSRFSRAA